MRWLIVILVSIFLLRLPSFFEPYYDGDEGVYYILGQMMARGAVLYRDIWDNKTPLIYFLYAVHPTILWVKLSATIFVLGTCLGVYFLAKKFKINALLATAATGVLLSLPALAGNTANSELYFTLPIVWGAYLVWKRRWPFVIGLLAAVAFLFKVPAILDFAGMFMATFLLRREFKFYFKMALAFIIPILLFVVYFYVNRALPDFILAAFTQNSTYVSVWSGPLGKLGNPLILRGVALLLILLTLFILFLKKLVSKEFLFLAFWLGFSIYAALLSGRPYPHYWLQIIVPGILLLFFLLSKIKNGRLLAVVFFTLVIFLGKRGENISYYQNFFDYISERKSWDDYQKYFGDDNVAAYQMANFLEERTKPNDPIFVWGENDYIYVLSGRPPATKFIRAHHLTTVDPKNYDLIIARLEKFRPKYIFISRPVQFSFPQLEMFVKKNYRETQTFGNFHVYKNIVPTNPSK